MYSDVITLFNRYETSDGDILWYPTVMRNVDLNADKAAIVAKYGEQTQDTAKLHVKYNCDSDGRIIIADKLFLPPKLWEGQTNDLLASSLTFADGVNASFFVVGEWGDGTATNEGEEYPREGLYSYLRKRLDYVFTITSVAQYSVIPHFEIMVR